MEISDSRKLELDLLFPDPLTTAATALNTQKKPWGRGKGGCASGVGTRGLSGKSLGVPSASEIPGLEKKRTQPRNATSADKERAPRAACFLAKRPAKGQPSRTNSLQTVTAPPSQAQQEKPKATLPSCPQRDPSLSLALVSGRVRLPPPRVTSIIVGGRSPEQNTQGRSRILKRKNQRNLSTKNTTFILKTQWISKLRKEEKQ